MNEVAEGDEMFELNFQQFGGPVYTGRDRGELARVEAGIDDIDIANVTIMSVVPQETYTLTSSFLLGLFGPSIKSAGSRENFLARHKFNMPEAFHSTLESCIERALRTQTNLLNSEQS